MILHNGSSEFFISKEYMDIEGYSICIYINGHTYTSTVFLSNLLGLTLEEYTELLKSFGAAGAVSKALNGLFFANEYDAKKFASYLNKKYIVMLKLADKI